jgi:hypothetical protein
MRPVGSSRSPADRERAAARSSEVAFEPTRLGRRPGNPDRARIVAGLVVAVVGVALVKPWDDGPASPAAAGPSPAPPTASSSPDASPAASAAAGPRWTGFGTQLSGAQIRWDDAVEALVAHDGWGVRALVDTPNVDGGIRPAFATLSERWEPAAPAIDGALGGSLAAEGTVSEAVVMPTGGQSVRALGVTAPSGRTPLELRAWWLPGNGAAPRWLDVRPVDPNVAGGHLLLLPPRLSDGPAAAWPAGSYRFDVLLGATVTRLTIILPHDGTLRDGAPFGNTAERTVDPLKADLGGLPAGPFVVAGGVAIRVPSSLGPALGEAAAWLDVASSADGTGTVAEVWLPGLNGIGAVLPVGARLEWAALERVAPAALVGVDAAARVLTDVRGRSSSVLFSPPAAEPWPAGTYALDVRWEADGVEQAGRWHVVVLPGPARRTGAWTSLAPGLGPACRPLGHRDRHGQPARRRPGSRRHPLRPAVARPDRPRSGAARRALPRRGADRRVVAGVWPGPPGGCGASLRPGRAAVRRRSAAFRAGDTGTGRRARVVGRRSIGGGFVAARLLPAGRRDDRWRGEPRPVPRRGRRRGIVGRSSHRLGGGVHGGPPSIDPITAAIRGSSTGTPSSVRGSGR